MSLRSQRAPRFGNVRTSMGIGFWASIAGERVSFPETIAGYWKMSEIKDRNYKALEKIVERFWESLLGYRPRLHIHVMEGRCDLFCMDKSNYAAGA